MPWPATARVRAAPRSAVSRGKPRWAVTESPGDPVRTYSDREIVDELFPATPEHLRPRQRRFRLEGAAEGRVLVVDRAGNARLCLVPVPPSGDPSHRLCCDLCGHTAARFEMTLLRSEVPGSAGRRWRYLTACLDPRSCDARRRNDDVVEQLLAG